MQARTLPVLVLLTCALGAPSTFGLERYTAFSLRAARARVESRPEGQDFRADDREAFELGGITTVKGLVVDPNTGDLILVGQRIPGRPALTLDDLVVALRARLVSDEWPEVSMDPVPETDRWNIYVVRFEGGIADSQFGKDLLDADFLLKLICVGYVDSGVEAIGDAWQLYVDMYSRLAKNGNSVEIPAIQGRFWYYPIVSRITVRDNVATFKDLKMGVFCEVLNVKVEGEELEDISAINDEAAERVASLISEHYDELAETHPCVRRVQQLNELVAATKAIAAMDRPVDLTWWLEHYDPAKVATPKKMAQVRRVGVLRRSDGKPGPAIELVGGVALRAVALRLRAGDVTALAEAVLTTRPSPEELTWSFMVSDWVIPLPSRWHEMAPSGHAEEVVPLYVHAEFLAQQKHYRQAVECAKEAIDLCPEYRDARCLLAICHIALDQYAEAASALATALGEAGGSAGQEKASGAAEPDVPADAAAQCLDLLARAVDRLPESPKFYELLCAQADDRCGQGDLDQARRLYQVVVARAEDSLAVRAQFAVGEIHFQKGEYAEALEAYRELVRRFPKADKVPAANERIEELQRRSQQPGRGDPAREHSTRR